MGADLITYMAFGPSRIDLDEQKTTDIARRIREYLDACINAAESLLTGQRDVPAPRPQPVEAECSVTLRFDNPANLPSFKDVEELRNHKDYRALVEQVLADCFYDVESEHVFATKLERLASIVQDFMNFWNDPQYRDCASRLDPDNPNRKVVVAGELSWGDEPEGVGYQILKLAFGLNLAQMLGIQ